MDSIKPSLSPEVASGRSPTPRRGVPGLVSVIIPAYNAAGTIGTQLSALTTQTYRGAWEIVVADNGSSDGTAELSGRWAGQRPRLRVVDASARPGAAFARNRGADVARGDFLAFCDADDSVAPGWLEAIVLAARGADVVGGRLEVEALNGAAARVRGVQQQTTGLPIGLGFLPFSLSSNIGVWTSVFRELGGWSEEFIGAAGEDVDFSWRAQLAGFQLSFAPHAVVHYRYRSDLRSLMRQHRAYGRAHPRLYRKFRPTGIPRSRLRTAVWHWVKLGIRIPYLFLGARRRALWLTRVAQRWGRVVGSVENRVIFL